MSFSARRCAGIFILATLAALPAMTAGDAHATTTTVKIGSSPSSTTTKHRSHHSRRARRAPPGGVYARNAVVFDPATGEVLYEKNAALSVPIASITKLMTAMVFLEQKPDFDREVEVTQAELSGGGHTQLRNHERVALGDLLHMSLMCSDNVATRVIVRESGLDMEDFLARMNQKALELGLTHSRFVEITGLDQRNVSTATDVARLLQAAASQNLVRDITTTPSYEFRSSRRDHLISNTNRLLYGRYEILGGKTGFISEAGYCLATWVRTQGREFIAVVLGAPTNATRFADVVRLIQRTTSPTVASTNS
ncbi:MAG TPA: serine hydrolase [Candidatus Sulfotelmatobacter sp.]|nr:serine hydrolase [Candidatus Sulfotelmatobacter sp.]